MAEPKMPEKLGRYEVIRELGKGAMGIVYEGKDPNIGRRVAIKTARREIVEASGMADEMMERFLREAQAAGALNHPNIITIYDAAEEDGIAYIAMEYLEGGDLGDLIEAKRKLSMEEIVEIGANICEALDVAHAHGVVHRDIKPANILMPTGKPLKVADFGIAHVSDSNLTQDGALIGTPHYMSPEQFMGQKLDGRSDLFSVANILYELTTGEKPFGGEALSTVMHHVIKTDPVNPTELNFLVPDALAQVIMTALSKRPAARYVRGNVMAEALRESLKPNPNADKLLPGGVAMEATIAGGAAPSTQETVIGGDVSGGATIAGGGPATQETTLTGNPPLRDATLPGGAPAATVGGGAPLPAGTLPGSPPSTESPDQLASTVPGAPEVPQGLNMGNAIAASGPSKGLLIGGAAAAVIIVIGAIMVFSGGSPADPTIPKGGNGGTSVAVNHPYYKSANLQVWRAKGITDYRAYNADGSTITIEDLRGKVDVPDNLSISITDLDGKEIISEENWNPSSQLDFPEGVYPKALRYVISVKNEGYDFSEDIPLAKLVGELATLERPILLPPVTPGS